MSRERFQQWQKLPKPGTFVQMVAFNTEKAHAEWQHRTKPSEGGTEPASLRTLKPDPVTINQLFIYIYICPGNPKKVWGLGPSIFLSSSLSSYFLLTFFHLPNSFPFSCLSFLLYPASFHFLFPSLSFLFFFSIFSPFFYHLPFSTPPSPICYFSPASPSALPSSDSVSRRRVERQKGVVRPRSTCWYSSCHKFSGQYWGACCCFSRGRRYRDQGENGWLGP